MTTSPSHLRAPLRALYGACGATLLVGFFMPWFKAGALLTISGLGLVFASGEMVGMLSGSHRFLLFAIPLLGVLLLGGAILGHRATSWVAVLGSTLILGYGFFTVVRLFVTSTGFGMWLVIAAALTSLSLGLLGVGRGRADAERGG